MSKSCIKRILSVMLSMLLVFGLTAFAAPALENVETLDATVAELEAQKLMATESTKEVAAADLDIAGFDTIFVSGTTEAQTLDAEATYTVALTDGLGFITLGSTTDASAFAVYKVTEEGASKLETAPIASEDVASIRGGERIGLRFRASVSNDLLAKTVEADGYAAAQYGFLVTLEKHVASVNALTMSLVDTGKAVKGVAFDKETGLNNIYETTESGVVFTGVLLGLPDTVEAYQTKLFVRPFVTLSTGAVLYGNPVNRTAHQIATAILESADEVDESILNFAVKVCDAVTEANKKWTVTFNVAGDVEAVEAQVVNDGKAANAVDVPAKPGYEGYWSLEEGGEEYDFATAVTEDITLYAVYEVLDKVSFVSEGKTTTIVTGESGDPEYLWRTVDTSLQKYLVIKVRSTDGRHSFYIDSRTDKGMVVSEFIENVTEEYSTFVFDLSQNANWVDGVHQYTAVMPRHTPTDKIVPGTLEFEEFYYGIEAPTAFTVTFNANGVETTESVYAGNKVAAKKASVPGYAFMHWSLEEGGEAYDFNTAVTEDITLYAVLKEIPTTFTFEDADINALWATRGVDPTAVVSFADGAMTVTQAADYTTIGNLGWTITDYKYLVVKAKSETNVNSVEFLVRGDADRRYYISGLTADYQTYYIDISECYGYTGSLTDVYVGQFNGTVTIDEIAFVNELPETVQYLAFSDFSADGSFSTPWSAADSWRLWPNAYGYLSYTKTIDVANKYFVIDFSAHAAVTPTGFDIFLRTTDANGDNPAQANYFVPVEVVGGQRHVIDMSEAFSGIWAEGKVVTHLRVMPATAANACESKVMDMYSMYLTSVAPYPTNTVTVIVNGDSTEKTIKSGAALSALSTPAAADGKYFSHWSLTEDGEAYDINTPVTEDITLYAVFEDALTTLGAMWTNAGNAYDTAISYSADGLRAVSASGTGRLVITGLSANAADYAALSIKVKENVDALSWIQFIVETENGNNYFNLENLSTDYNEYVFDLSTLNGNTIVCMQILAYEGVAFDLSFSQIEFLTFEDLDVPTTLGYSWSPIEWCPAELSYAPGSFTMASTDGSGRMYIPGMSDKVDDYKYLAVRVKNNGVGERVRLLFENDVENMNYHVVGITSEYQDYYFDISALHGKTITTIQLLASTAYSFTFEKIEFTNELPENVQYLDFTDWAAEGDMNATWSAAGNWRAWVTGTGYLSYNKVADIDTANNYFVIDFASHGSFPAAGFNIFVRTTDANGENAAQADYFVPVSEYVTVDGAYECQRYVVNLSEAFAGIWAEGKVVTHLRVYTATEAGAYDAKIMDMKEMYLTSLSE